MGGDVFPSCWLFGLRHPSTGASRLLDAARSQSLWPRPDVCLQWEFMWWHCLISLPLPPVSTSPGGATATPQPPQETLQDQQVSLAQAPMKSLLLPWVPVCVRPCVYPPRVESVSPILWSSYSQTLLPSKPNTLGDSPPDVGPQGWGAWRLAQDSSSCGRISVIQLFSGWYGIFYIKCTPLTVSLWFLLCVFGCRISFLVGSSLFYWWLFSS